MTFSVLIPTLDARRELFVPLHAALTRQIREGGWDSEVEVLSLADSGVHSVGWKRNQLIARASGLFVAFIDDDDTVSPDYVSRICTTIRENPDIDCIGIRGQITFRGRHPHEFIHSLRYADYFSAGHTYFRPPYHLNPIRREIAARYRFPDVSYSEDIAWAMQMQRDGALRKEVFLDSVLYHYRSRRSWTYQWILDATESVRHRFGIRLANRLALQLAAQSLTRRWSRHS
jgi:glycosyltransferase involved in cell wall biosynthesis